MWEQYPEMRPDYEMYLAKMDIKNRKDAEVAKKIADAEAKAKEEEERLAKKAAKEEKERLKKLREKKKKADEKITVTSNPPVPVHD